MNVLQAITISLLFCTASHAAYLKQLQQLNRMATRIQSTRHSNPEKAQRMLLEQIKHIDLGKDKRALPILENIVSALAYKKTYASLTEKNSDLLVKSTQAFLKAKGFAPTFKKTIASVPYASCFKGNLYEFEHALEMEEVKGFNISLQEDGLKREFDVVTEDSFVECKNITWPKKLKKKLQQQFLDQKRLVDNYNSANNQHKMYCISSKQPIPAVWQKWFESQKISIS